MTTRSTQMIKWVTEKNVVLLRRFRKMVIIGLTERYVFRLERNGIYRSTDNTFLTGFRVGVEEDKITVRLRRAARIIMNISKLG